MNLDGHCKEDLRQKGAAAVFRAACSIRRSTPRGAVGRVESLVIYPQIYFIYPKLKLILISVIIGSSLSPAFAAEPSPGFSKNLSFFDLDF